MFSVKNSLERVFDRERKFVGERGENEKGKNVQVYWT